MVHDPDGALERLRDQIETTDDLTEADRDALTQFSDALELRKSEYSVQRHEKLLRHCAILAGLAQRIPEDELPDATLTDALDDRDAAEDLVRWINRRYDNEETNRDYRVALRMFAKHVTGGDEIPDSVEWVPTTTSRNYKPKPDPANMLDWNDDVLPMIDAAMNSRDEALIAVAWDSGARSGELRSLTVGDVSDHKHGLRITVDGKTGQRSVTLMPSVPYLQRWLSDHPDRDNPNAPLWTKLSKAEDISYQQFRKALQENADRAGVPKPVTLTNFRKSSAAYLASRGMNQAHIEDHHGWSHGSNVAARYVSVFAEDADNQLARIHGKDVEEEEPDPIAPRECPRCSRENPPDEDLCVWCGQALDPGAVESIKERERDVRSKALELVQERPEVVSEIERAEQLMDIIDDDPELSDEIRRLADSLD